MRQAEAAVASMLEKANAWMTADQKTLSQMSSASKALQFPTGLLNELDAIVNPSTRTLEEMISSNGFLIVDAEPPAPKTNSLTGFDAFTSGELTDLKLTLTTKQAQDAAANVIVSFPGLSDDFRSAVHCISDKPAQAENETQQKSLDAMSLEVYRLMAFQTLSVDDTIPALKFIDEWHKSEGIAISPLHRSLAETAYHFDDTNNRLIIRHLPIEAACEKDNADSRALLKTVTETILEYLEVFEVEVQIEHIIPKIVPGYLADFTAGSRHIVLELMSQRHYSFADTTPSTTTVIDQRGFFSDKPQAAWNFTDCGSYVAVMAAIACRELAADPSKKASELTIKDFMTYLALHKAPEARETKALRALLKTLQKKTPTLQNSTFNAEKKSTKRSGATYGIAFYQFFQPVKTNPSAKPCQVDASSTTAPRPKSAPAFIRCL